MNTDFFRRRASSQLPASVSGGGVLAAGTLSPSQFAVDGCGFSLPPDDRPYVDIPWLPSYERTLAAGELLTSLKKTLDADAWFYWCGIAQRDDIDESFQAGVNVWARFQAPDGYYLSNTRIPLNLAAGIGSQRAYGFEQPIACPPGSAIGIDLENLSIGPQAALIQFVGFKRFFFDAAAQPPEFMRQTAALGVGQNPLTPEWFRSSGCAGREPGWMYEPYDAELVINTATPNPVAFDQPLFIGTQDFLWTELRFFEVTNDASGRPAVRIKDSDGTYFSKDFLLLSDLVGSYFPGNWLPAGGRYLVDLQQLDVVGIGSMETRLVFRGFRRMRVS